MTEKKPTGRPTGRPKTEAKGSAEAYRRGEGLNTGKVGNADYDERNASSNRPSSGSNRDIPNNPLGGIGGLGGYGEQNSYHSGSNQNPFGMLGGLGGGFGSSNYSGGNGPRRSRGGLLRIIFFVVLILFVMNMLGMCGTSTSDTDSGLVVNTPDSTVVNNNTTSAGGHWTPVSTTYQNGST